MAERGKGKPRGDQVTPDEASAIARVRGSKRSDKAERINWIGVREEYVTGSETPAQIASRLGVSKRTVEEHAGDRTNTVKTWAEARSDFREDVARTFRSTAAKRQVDEAISVYESQVRNVAALVEAAMPVALDALNMREVMGADAVKLAISALRAQSQVHGLERAARVELTGKDGGAIEHDVAFEGKLDDATAVLGASFIETVFGKAAE